MDRAIPRSYFDHPSRSAPKVVSIPVHFVRSDTARSTSALKIQKVFRGFLVRKSIKEIISIKRDVDEAERKVSCMIDTIRRDPKEKLRMNETLMALLFKLDSVRSMGPGVRDCRKAVIKKAIALQEKIDGCDQSGADDVAGGASAEIEAKDSIFSDQGLGIEDTSEKIDVSPETGADVANRAIGVVGEQFGDCIEYPLQEKIDCCDGSGADVADQGVETEGMMEDDDYCIVKQVVVGEGEGDLDTKSMAKKVEEDGFESETKLKVCDDEAKKPREEDEREMMERMVEENGKMMTMMQQLSEQNQAQTRMLTLLSQRVEQLEKAFVCEISRKKIKDKKKRAAANGIADRLDCYPDTKKCGKR